MVRPKLWKQGRSISTQLALHRSVSGLLNFMPPSVVLPNYRIRTMAEPICQSSQQASVLSDLVSTPRITPGSALPIWVSGPCVLILFEGSRDPCRVLATTAEPPSPGPASALVSPAHWRCHPSLAAASPCSPPQPRAGCQEAGSHSSAREPSPQEERLGVEPFPATCQSRERLQRQQPAPIWANGQHRENKLGNELTRPGRPCISSWPRNLPANH